MENEFSHDLSFVFVYSDSIYSTLLVDVEVYQELNHIPLSRP